MSFKSAIPHLEQALAHAKASNAAKSMHHIGHALYHLRGMTSNAGGATKLPAPASVPSKSDTADDQDADDKPNPGSLRARLASANSNAGRGGNGLVSSFFGGGTGGY